MSAKLMQDRDPGTKFRTMETETKFAAKVFATLLVAGTFGLPNIGLADNIPDNFSQELDPNYVACLMAVDDAETEFRDTLQSACLQRMGDLCSGRNGLAPPSQVIDCIHFETQRGIDFLRVATSELPEFIEKEGLFGHGYERRRDSIFNDVELLTNSPKPQSIETAVQQSVEMASAVTLLFWLARETQTPLDAYVATSFDHH
ncbi:hypothetical protein [uncultured Tateyamaria sp.]|uniref:hypothetical protein n=1 Tax=uncultured Tateyamaria sp. TaxID=455651 RepID=UPI0026162C21|nr:hypothetical protein [uncultured Tateyamaria sp.]